MKAADVERLLGLLEVQLNAFAMCEIGDGWSLRCKPLDMVVVHYVLRGEGSIQYEKGRIELRPGTLVVVPRHLAKSINGRGIVSRTVDTEVGCPLADGIIRFAACEARKADLVLGCASVTATVGKGLGLFDNLRGPLVDHACDAGLTALFSGVLAELEKPRVGTKSIVEGMMKHIIILLLRAQVEQRRDASDLCMPLMDPQLGRALATVIAKPEAAYTLDGLAQMAGMSRSRFGHHFAATYGRSPMEFVNWVRLKSAARMLRDTSLPIKSIAAAVGYGSRSHFSRAFRAQFGLDPSGFRGEGGEGGESGIVEFRSEARPAGRPQAIGPVQAEANMR
jgi:AraC-like DNA-binding protein